MHQNNIYKLFFKIYFWYQYIKMIQKHKKNLKQKIFFEFLPISITTALLIWGEKRL
jgi:hypothetical protein